MENILLAEIHSEIRKCVKEDNPFLSKSEIEEIVDYRIELMAKWLVNKFYKEIND